MKELVIIDKHDRSKLGEGRTSNIGFGFLQKLSDHKYETAHAPSPCKDYLNDVVYGEHLEVEVTVYGLHYKPQGIFDKVTSYMVMKVFPPNRPRPGNGQAGAYYGGINKTLEEDIKLLETNYKNIEKLINWVEDKIAVKRTTITKANDDFYLITFDYYWSSQTYLISLYTLLLRMSQIYDGKESPEEFYNNYKHPNDIMLWNQAKPKLMLLLQGKKTEQIFDKKTGGNIHGMGISTYNAFKF